MSPRIFPSCSTGLYRSPPAALLFSICPLYILPTQGGPPPPPSPLSFFFWQRVSVGLHGPSASPHSSLLFSSGSCNELIKSWREGGGRGGGRRGPFYWHAARTHARTGLWVGAKRSFFNGGKHMSRAGKGASSLPSILPLSPRHCSQLASQPRLRFHWNSGRVTRESLE